MNRPAKIVCFSYLLLPLIAITLPHAIAAAPRAEAVIYKHVDENGRVTYANSPIKGGARVDLEPLTVIPSTPSGSLNPANAQGAFVPVVSRVVIPSTAAVSAPVAPSGKPALHVASVLPLSIQAQSAAAKANANTNANAPAEESTVLASIAAINQLTLQRRAETKKRLLEGELQNEEQMLVAAKSKLEEERKNSGNVRAMRASFAATSETVTAQKPLISPETRAEIERHFERVRNLQDQVAMHENHLQSLQEQVGTLK